MDQHTPAVGAAAEPVGGGRRVFGFDEVVAARPARGETGVTQRANIIGDLFQNQRLIRLQRSDMVGKV